MQIQKLVTHKGAVSHRRGAIQTLVTLCVHESQKLPDGEYRKGKHNASTARESNSPIVTCASQMHPPSLVPQGKTGTTVIGKRGVNILGAACTRSIIATLQHGQGTYSTIKIQPLLSVQVRAKLQVEHTHTLL